MLTKFKKDALRTKLAIRFGLLMLIFTIAMFLTFVILNNSITINNKIINVYNPSVKKLDGLKLYVINSRALINSWVANQSDNSHPDKIKLRELLSTNIPAAEKEIMKLSENWSNSEKTKFKKIFKSLQALQGDYEKVMKGLGTFDSYLDVQLMLGEITPMVQEGGAISNKYNQLVVELDELIGIHNQNADSAGREMTSSLNTFKKMILFIIVLTTLIAILITVNTVRIITLPIIHVKDVLVNMGKGILPDFKLKAGKDEIGEMSSALNYLNDGLRKTAAYADRIGNGDMEATFEPLSEKDLLGNSLLEMGRKLKKLSEEDMKRNWAATGLAEFAQLLRENSNMQLLFDSILSSLVKYVGANQGALFLVNDSKGENETYLELSACYAYERKKFLEKIIYPGEGLIGQCYIEKDIIYLTEIPDKYTHITSGLGAATPNCISMFPLIVNESIMGVIELASFKVLDKYELDFIKKLCENIAGAVSNVRVNQRTVQLLENAKVSQQRMVENEEELRQNLEELTAAQEEMQRRENDFKKQISDLENELQLQLNK